MVVRTASMEESTMSAIDEHRLEAFMERVVSDVAAAESAAVNHLGDRLGLYRSMAGAGAVTPRQLAQRTGLSERYVREWLANQVAGGYVAHDAGTGTFELPDEHALVLADDDSDVFMAGMFEIAAAMWAAIETVADAFRTGDGVGWGDHDDRLYRGVERSFAPLYRSQLVQQWIPALDGVDATLRSGGHVADVGCGHGVSTRVMAQAYPEATFHGYDLHEASIAAARKATAEAGLSDRVSFDVADATGYEASGVDLVCFFDCLHDMGDPVAAATHARRALADDGAVLLVEPAAADDLDDNVTPVNRLFYASSVFLCTPSSLDQDGARGLGAQAGQQRLREVMHDAGFSRFRRAAETPFNHVYEARP
jgi:SAM-dependent methyltransferase